MSKLLIINKYLWLILTFFITFLGIFFTFKLKGIQFKIKKIDKNKNYLNTLMISLGGKIGVGSISGMAISIYIGGPGTIFWIWIISIITATISYAETYLSILYKNNNYGGPSYYLKYGLNNKLLAFVYSILIIFTHVVGYNCIQANTVIKSINFVYSINPILIGLLFCIISAIIIFNKIDTIVKISGKIVPIMSIIYIIVTSIIIIFNINLFPKMMILIIKSAFNLKSFFSGFIITLITGVQRGIFANETGLGTSGIAATFNDDNDSSMQGYIQMVGSYFISIIICSLTCFVIILSNYDGLNIIDPNGVELVLYAFKNNLGQLGIILLLICIFLFALSTIISDYYFCERSLQYITSTDYTTLLKYISIITIFISSFISPSLLWVFIDILIAIVTFVNLYAIYKLRKKIKRN